MEAVGYSETLVCYCKITWHHNLEDFDLHPLVIGVYLLEGQEASGKFYRNINTL